MSAVSSSFEKQFGLISMFAHSDGLQCRSTGTIAGRLGVAAGSSFEGCRVLRLPDLDHCKLAVLNSLGSPASRRVYEYAIEQCIAWYCSEPRLA
jgi:hypothetical protein